MALVIDLLSQVSQDNQGAQRITSNLVGKLGFEVGLLFESKDRLRPGDRRPRISRLDTPVPKARRVLFRDSFYREIRGGSRQDHCQEREPRNAGLVEIADAKKCDGVRKDGGT